MAEPINQIHVRYYCPLKLAVFERDEYGDLEEDGYDLDGRYAARYEYEIRELLEKEHSYDGCDPRSMATYQDNPKIRAVRWDVENVRGTLYGCMHVDLSAPLTAEEDVKFQAWLTGQNSDGFGEGLEQREFEIDDGEGSPHNKSLTVIPKSAHISSIMEASGRDLPVSHLDTARSVIPSFSASWACVRFCSFLFHAINFPILI